MFLAKKIATGHKDLIHDIAYDFHGRRIATSSCDQNIKIWDLVNGEWTCTASLKAHSGIVWKVCWAYPDFGQVIATCSNDKTVAVWEEIPTEDGQEGGHHWIKRGNLVDSRSPIVDVKFAPRHHGLKLAMCSLDGNIRIYEAPDIMNLCQWNLQNEINCKVSCSCLAWGPSRLHPPLIVAGCDDGSLNYNILLYEFSDQLRTWSKVESVPSMTGGVRDLAFSPNLGRSFDLLAVAGAQLTILLIRYLRSEGANKKEEVGPRYEVRVVAEFNDHQAQVWRVCWNISGTILTSSGDDGCIRLWKGNSMDSWQNIAVLKSDANGIVSVPPANISRQSLPSQSQDKPQHPAYISTGKTKSSFLH